MSLPTTQELESLSSAEPQIAISAYIPLDNDSPDAMDANEIRIKNLVSDIEDVMSDHKSKMNVSMAELTKPLTDLKGDAEQLWQRKMKSIAVFVDESQLRHYFLPVEIDDPVFQIQESFYLDPLVAAADNESYYALSISHEHAQLYKFNKHDIEPIDVPGLPSGGMEEVLNIDEYPDAHQFHGESPRASEDDGSAGGTHQHHGHYEPNDVDKDLVRQYFRQLNGPLSTYLQKSQAPVVFVGVEWLFPIFKDATTIDNLHDDPLAGNYQHANDDELLQKLKQHLNLNTNQ